MRASVRKFGYGGDVHAPAHSLYNNVTCWRGLRDTGLMFKRVGDKATADALPGRGRKASRPDPRRFGRRRSTTRPSRRLCPSASTSATRTSAIPTPPTTKRRSGPTSDCSRVNLGNYWNLFMQILLELQFYPARAGRSRSGSASTAQQHRRRMTLGLARFRDGVDWHYGVGYIKYLLWSGRREEFLLSLYAALAHGAARRSAPRRKTAPSGPPAPATKAFRQELHARAGTGRAATTRPGVLRRA